MQTDNTLSITVLQKCENISFFKNLEELASNKKISNKMDEVKKIEGSGFGCPLYGFYDGIINFLQRLLVFIKIKKKQIILIIKFIYLFFLKFRHHKEYKKMNDIWDLLTISGLDNSIINIFINLNPKFEISPKGFISFLILIHDVITCDFKSFSQKIYSVIYKKKNH